MRIQEPLRTEVEVRRQPFMIGDMEFQFVREIERIVPRNDVSNGLDVRDLLPDVVLPLGDIWPLKRAYAWQRHVRLACPYRWCVYLVRSPEETLYVGMTHSGLHQRIAQHFHGRSELGVILRYAGAEVLGYMTEQYLMPDRKTALQYEAEMIQYRSPKLNITHNTASGHVTRMAVAS